MLTDTHCHLYYDDIKRDLSRVLDDAEKLGVNRFICVGTNVQESRECLEIANTHEKIYATAGIHPHDAKGASKDYLDQICSLLKSDKMIAVGEIGLDYYRNISEPEIQNRVFREQMELAQLIKKPVVFHNRDADTDVLKVLLDFPDVTGVAHCFSSNLEIAKSFLDIGYYISFAGNLTFKNSHLPEVAKELPLDRILVETDCPYLSPVPYRGKPNEPGRTRFVAEKLADIHNVSLDVIAIKTSENATTLFNLPS